MQSRPLVPWGLVLLVSAGCQSYYPNGYGHNGPYSAFPSGPYVPSTTMPSSGAAAGGRTPTPIDGQKNLQSGEKGTGGSNSKAVPDYKTPKNAPDDLGAQGTEEENDSIKRRGNSSRGKSGTSAEDSAGDDGDSLSSINDERFISPVEYKDSAVGGEAREPRRLAAKTGPSPYKKDPSGYSWLRGVVARDPKSGSWRLTYGRDDSDDDSYGGTLTLADDEGLDTLKDGDVILVEGNIERSNLDRSNRPCYRVDRLTPLKPKGQ